MGDLHLHDYRSHNLFGDPRFRLNQFDKLFVRLNEVIAQYECKCMFVAGDLYHEASPRPYVGNKLSHLLSTIPVPIYCAHGQHDMDSRGEFNPDDTYLSMLAKQANIQYLHRDSIELDGKSFYFCGWEKDFDVTRVMGHDILIGHATVPNTKINQKGFVLKSDKEIRCNSFELAFLGDIHHHQVVGNIVVPGVPMQHCFNDPVDPGVIIYDTANNSWEFVKTETKEHKFLRFIVTDDIIEDEYTVTSPFTIKKSAITAEAIVDNINLNQVIKDKIKEKDLEKLHEQISKLVRHKDVRINYNFTIQRLIISNVRSIDSFVWDMKNGLSFIIGENGSGKSTIITAINYAFTGKVENNIKEIIREGEKGLTVELDLVYGGLEHKIVRGYAKKSGFLQYYINNQIQEGENLKAIEQIIKDNLPFLNMFDLMYHSSHRLGFLSSYSSPERIRIIKRVLNLDLVEELNIIASEQLSGLKNNILQLESKHETLDEVLKQEEDVEYLTVDDSELSALQALKQNAELVLKEERAKELASTKDISIISGQLKNIEREAGEKKIQLEKLKTGVCFACGQTLKPDDELAKEITGKIDALREEYRDLKQTLIGLGEYDSTNLAKTTVKVNELIREIAKIDVKKQTNDKIKKLEEQIKQARIKQNDYNKQIKNYAIEVETLQKYVEVTSNKGAIMETLLRSISEKMSNDEVKVLAYHEQASGNLKLDLNTQLKIGNEWRNYNKLSDGERSIADLCLLKSLINIVGGVGCLIFDETFKYLGNNYLEMATEVLKTIQTEHCLIVSHAPNISSYDNLVRVFKEESSTRIELI